MDADQYCCAALSSHLTVKSGQATENVYVANNPSRMPVGCDFLAISWLQAVIFGFIHAFVLRT